MFLLYCNMFKLKPIVCFQGTELLRWIFLTESDGTWKLLRYKLKNLKLKKWLYKNKKEKCLQNLLCIESVL